MLMVVMLASSAGAQQAALEVGMERSATALAHRHVFRWEARSASWQLGLESRWIAERLFFSSGFGPRRDDWWAQASLWRGLPLGAFGVGLQSLYAGPQDRLGGWQRLLWARWRYEADRARLLLGPLWGWDRRSRRQDHGPGLHASLGFEQMRWGNYRLSGRAEGQQLWVGPRLFQDARLDGELEGLFAPAEFQLRASWVRARRDYYQPASFLNIGAAGMNVIESTRADTLWGEIALLYPMGSGILLRSRLRAQGLRREVLHRRVPVDLQVLDTGLERLSLEAETGCQLTGRWGQLGLVMGFLSEEEVRRLLNGQALPPALLQRQQELLALAGYWVRQTRLSAFYLWPGGVRLDGMVRIARYDTPEGNDDDFDELLLRLGVLLEPWRGPIFSWSLLLQGQAVHTVYLKAARSAENQWRRLLRLEPSWRWQPAAGQEVRARAELRASYATDDFRLPGRTPRDQSARELRMELFGDHQIGARWGLLWQLSYSRLLIGRLFWPEFAETPVDTVRTWELWPRLKSRFPGSGRIEVELGLRLYSRTHYLLLPPARALLRQWGPAASLSWLLGPRAQARLEGWLQWQGSGTRPFSSAQSSSWSRRQIPNVNLVFSWML
jgi:hypothetical protein|nr:MAG: hypothetical protein KatS3mg041_1777 [Bacteroidota bacterium]